MKTPVESWEKPKIRRLYMIGLAAGVAGMAAILGLSFIFRAIGWGAISSGVLWIPWMVVATMLISIAYHQGVCDEREREKEKD